MAYLGFVADFDGGVGAEVVDPYRVLGGAAFGADQDVVVAVFDAHQRGFADGAGFVAPVGYDDDRQAGVAEGGSLQSAAAFVSLYLLAHPVGGGRYVFGHSSLLFSGWGWLEGL